MTLSKSSIFLSGFLLISLSIVLTSCQRGGRTVYVPLGGHCAPGAAPIGPGGSFTVVERNVRKICPSGTSCRRGACNCDDLRDGTVTSMSVDRNGNRSCRRVAGQRCSQDNQCFDGVRCQRGICTCDPRSREFCVTEKDDIRILA